MQPVPLPAPYAGVDDRTPVLALQPPFCENLFNFNVVREGCSLRKGDSKYYSIPSPYFSEALIPYGDTKLFLVTTNVNTGFLVILDVDLGSVVYTSPDFSGAIADTLYFNKYLFVFDPALAARGAAYNGTTWGALGYTGDGVNPFSLTGGAVYNHRAYMIAQGEPAYWYSGIDAITGTTTRVNLATVVADSCYLTNIAQITIADSVAAENLLAFVFSNGEVLFYKGSYPDSADWSIVGTAKVGSPLNLNSTIPYQGDALLPCDTGLISLRDLFLKGAEGADSLSVNSRIQSTWQTLVQNLRVSANVPVGPIIAAYFYVRGVWDSKTGRIIISFPGYIDPANPSDITRGSFYFVFNTSPLLQSWCFQRSFGPVSDDVTLNGICLYKNKVLTLATNTNGPAGGMIYVKEGATGFMDRKSDDSGDVGYDYNITSAPLSNGRAYIQKVEGMDVILNSDLYAQTSYKLIKDLGVAETSSQILSGVNADSLQKPFVNLGIEGSYVQYKISGTTVTGKTTGLVLYGTNVWIEKGKSPR